VRAQIQKAKLEDINQVLNDVKAGIVNGRVVLMM
jgi:D-arabinose 1-dehydrogenase-like Zn-dependent alcohol dehydrogenase